ncbi:MAG TPA: hypothetical protein DIV41_08065 [Ruminococcaceae bacterium]|nr:hypothetical protein [Oscillospiraceae bacterium]
MDYNGLKCPVCGKTFTKDDDIVVCPECGAPYHRECYAKAGRCVFSEKHGQPGSAWKPQKTISENGPAGADETTHCPRCGFINRGDAMFCQHCGLPLGEIHSQYTYGAAGGRQPPYGQGQRPFGGQRQQPFGQGQQPYGAGQPFFFDPLGGVNPNETIDDIPVGEVARFVQDGTQYYIPVFMNLKKFAKNRFNFSAFLFPGIWMLYRKMYKLGSVITSLAAALYVLSAYVTYNFILPIFKDISGDIGGTLDPFSMTSQQMSMFAMKLESLSGGQRFLCNLPGIILLLQIAIMVISGIYANRVYLKHSVSSIQSIRKGAGSAAQAEMQIASTGGVNTFAATCAVIIYTIIYYLIASF